MTFVEIPHGYCQCGCGGRTRLATRANPRYGHVKGQPISLIHGHQRPTGWSEVPGPLDTPCRVWAGFLNHHGYARMQKRGRKVLVHRELWIAEHGPIPEGLEPDHLCRNRACVHVDHLELVTHHENVLRGSLTKLSEDQVAEVRRLCGHLSQTAVARRFGVSQSHVSALVHRKRRWEVA